MLYWYWETGCISDPAWQVHLSIASILSYRENFWCWMTGLTQYCIDTEEQDIFLTLHDRFSSVLCQYCHTGWISDVAWQDYLNVALILRNRIYFWPCMPGSPQYCANTVIQGKFLMLDDRIHSVLYWYWGTGCIFDLAWQVQLSIVLILSYRVNFWCWMTGLTQYCTDTEVQDVFMTLHDRFKSVLH